MKDLKKSLSLMTLATLTLGAFTLSINDVQAQEDDEVIFNYEDYPETTTNDGEPLGEGVLRVGYVSNEVFVPVFSHIYSGSGTDGDLMTYFTEPLLTYNENHQYTNDGPMQYELNEEDNTITFTMTEGILWHDGTELTIDHYISAYEVVGHPDYAGLAGSDDGYMLVEGFEEYKNGEADSISGIERVDDYTAVFTYKELAPSLTYGGIPAEAHPYHYYEGVAIEDIPSAVQSLEEPIGFGPYKVTEVIPGEYMTLERFDDYWRGTPQMDGIEINFIPSSTIMHSLESGNIDMVFRYPRDQFQDSQHIEGIEWISAIDPGYNFIGFKLGYFDYDEGHVVYQPDEMKMGDKNLRLAMYHAIDIQSVGEQFHQGIRWKANSVITPYYEDFWDEDLEAPEYDRDLARQILADAGYEDIDGDGFVETPDGEPLEITYADMSGGDTQEALSNYYLQSWRDIGLNVSFLNGRLIEPTTFYTLVENDDPEIDVFHAGFGAGPDVNPYSLWGSTAPYNFTRFESEDNTRLLEAGNSLEALDEDYRIEVYQEWQNHIADEVPVIPLFFGAFVVPIDENVVNYSIGYGFNEETLLYNVGFTELPEDQQ